MEKVTNILQLYSFLMHNQEGCRDVEFTHDSASPLFQKIHLALLPLRLCQFHRLCRRDVLLRAVVCKDNGRIGYMDEWSGGALDTSPAFRSSFSWPSF